MAKPIKSLKSGQFEVALWKNEHEKDGKKFDSVSASLQKSWKQKDEWKKQGITIIPLNDIPKIIVLLQKAYEDQMVNKNE